MKLRKLASRWIPHELTKTQKRKRVEICQKNLAKFKEGKWRLCDVITGDELWIYHRKIEKKAINGCWVNEGEMPKTVVKRDRFEPKSMFCVFFKTTGPVLIHCVDRGKTIDHKYYVEKKNHFAKWTKRDIPTWYKNGLNDANLSFS